MTEPQVMEFRTTMKKEWIQAIENGFIEKYDKNWKKTKIVKKDNLEYWRYESLD